MNVCRWLLGIVLCFALFGLACDNNQNGTTVRYYPSGGGGSNAGGGGSGNGGNGGFSQVDGGTAGNGVSGAAGSSGAAGAGGTAGCKNMAMTLKGGETLDPAAVRLYLKITTCDGKAVTGLDETKFEASEDGKPINAFESNLKTLPTKQVVRFGVVLLLDMSGSIIKSGSLRKLQDAAITFVNALAGDQLMAIYLFDGREDIQLHQDFTNDPVELTAAINALTEEVVDSSTNLNGAIIKGLERLDSWQAEVPGALASGSLTVFTDGDDLAGRKTDQEAVDAVQQSRHSVFAIGLGQDIDQTHLKNIAEDQFVLADNIDTLKSKFEQTAAAIKNAAESFYVVAYCSPSRAGQRNLSLALIGESVSVDFCFNATGFSGGCQPTDFLNAGTSSLNSCPVNSGWPCSCTSQTCSDGSRCASLGGLKRFVCMPKCTADSKCPCENYAAKASCNVEDKDTGDQLCVLLDCTKSSDCPAGQSCSTVKSTDGKTSRNYCL